MFSKIIFITFILIMSAFVSKDLRAAANSQGEPKVDLQYIQSLLEDSSTTDVESFISKLPSHMKSGSHITFAFKAHGLLESSIEHPLAFLFGNYKSDSVVVLSTKPNPEKNIEKVEVLNFDREKKLHTLSEITFQKNMRPIIEHNPRSCVSCHGSASRPLWGSSYLWEGFIGEYNDLLYTNKHGKKSYKNLTKNLNERTRLLGLTRQHIGENGYRYNEPNSNLSLKLGAQHAVVIANKILKHPNYLTLRKELFKALSLCSPPDVLERILAELGIPKDAWYLNTDLKTQPPRGSYSSIYRLGTAFDAGVGAIENIVISRLLENDPTINANSRSLFPHIETVIPKSTAGRPDLQNIFLSEHTPDLNYLKLYVSLNIQPGWCEELNLKFQN